jgi:hypothetical protein
VPTVAFPLAGASGALLAVAELRDVDLRQGDADEVLALLADHLAAADVLAQVTFHLTADDFAEPLVVAFNLLAHGSPLASVYFLACPRAKMLATKLSTSVKHTSQ